MKIPVYNSFFIALSKLKYVLLLLITTLIISTSCFYFFYDPVDDTNFSNSIDKSLIASFALLVGLEPFNYPHHGNIVVKTIYLILPILGMIIISLGMIEYGFVVFSKRNRLNIWNEWLGKKMKNHNILVGLGNVGTRVLMELKNHSGDIVVITYEKPSLNELIEEIQKEPNISIIFGDATQKSILKKANIKDARAILVTTNDDLVNLKIASIARKMNPTIRTIIRAFDQEFAQKITELFDIDKAISTSAIAAPAFVAASYEDGVKLAFPGKKNKERYLLVDIIFGKKVEPVTVQELEDRYLITIIAINNEFHPQEEDIIKAQDHVLVLGELKVIKEIKSIYCDNNNNNNNNNNNLPNT